ncbi:LysR family transcriptional regulator [Affinibrenneria salicis]|uniref:LysR family transcriptional regulator n=1 Tax=Affinibrenneria salicis TaxID=2590031 RepID=A0A5J5G6V9_9GAMM|nr:LysR family transcriptional regulator [Affinibrenneria salicis]KAA9002784.1 LysR family transcriptional regulator [Affinibrenneria salicis]KAA9002929.1 LysR family transcriptional regulator [Affinibrenneria salicis]
MDIRQLKHFVAVAETLHFGKAAERLNMTQPPLSQSILSLERELGEALFSRTKRTVALTPFGEQWLPHVRSALACVNALPGLANRLRKGEAGRLALSFVSTADYSVLPALVSQYRSRYPTVDLALTEATSNVQIASLLNDKSDAGIIIPPANTALPAELSYKKLLSEPLIAALPESWARQQRLRIIDGKLCPSSVIDAPLIIFPQPLAPAFHALVMSYYASYGTQANVIQHAIQMQTIISLVAAGMGIALVPNSLRHLARTGVVYLDLLDDPPQLDTGLVWRKDNASPTLKNLIAIALEAI